jgi:AcrR family transcriptional regulator
VPRTRAAIRAARANLRCMHASSNLGSDAVPGPRRRADWVSSRQRILDAAADLFSQRGYRRTNTMELAQAAGVAEATLFRHFQTKAQLFEQAVISPLRDSIAELTERRRLHPPNVSNEAGSFTFYDEMLHALRKDARLLIAALAALTFEEETSEFSGITSAFSDLLDYMDPVFRRRAAERGFEVDPVLGSRMMLALVLGFALGDRMLFEDSRRPGHKHLAAELAKFTAFGLPGKPAGNAAT